MYLFSCPSFDSPENPRSGLCSVDQRKMQIIGNNSVTSTSKSLNFDFFTPNFNDMFSSSL